MVRCKIQLLSVLVATACGSPQLPPEKLVGSWHEVSQGDDAASVARRYGADEQALIELNDLPRDGSMKGREEVFVPKAGGDPPGTGAPPPEPVAAAAAEPKGEEPAGRPEKKRGRCGEQGRPCLAWPADGEVGTGFGESEGRRHDGIDIVAPDGSEVRAADAGQVLYSGDGIEGYGNLLILSHASGLMTVYAHNRRNLVEEGDRVERGAVIAEVGESGAATAPHLHFEVRVDERPADPLLYLPGR
ncbi:MAG: LysM peptidoglycan-binding domain-containing M23 family metallopeptidase [Polyangia bacterium]